MAQQNRRPRRSGDPTASGDGPPPAAIDARTRPADKSVRVPAQPPPRRHRARSAALAGLTRPVMIRAAVVVALLAVATLGVHPVPAGPGCHRLGRDPGRRGRGGGRAPRPVRRRRSCRGRPGRADAGEPPPLGPGRTRRRAGQPALLFAKGTVTVATGGFLSWAVMDRRTGEIFGSANLAATTWPASMIKSWIAADYLRRSSDERRPRRARSATSRS